MTSCENVDTACEIFTSTFLIIAKDCIPCTNVIIRPNDQPWMTAQIRQEIRKRRRLYHEYIRSKCANKLSRYKKQRNRVNTMIKYRKAHFFSNNNYMIDDLSTNNQK